MHYAQPTDKFDVKPHVDAGELVMLIPNIRVQMFRTKLKDLLPDVPSHFQAIELFFS